MLDLSIMMLLTKHRAPPPEREPEARDEADERCGEKEPGGAWLAAIAGILLLRAWLRRGGVPA